MPTNTNPSKNTPSNEEPVTRSADRSQQLANRILAGITSKRSDEEWEHYVERTIELFRQKSLFKNEPITTTTNLQNGNMAFYDEDRSHSSKKSSNNFHSESLSQRKKTNQILIYE
jgi:hypothetical protein